MLSILLLLLDKGARLRMNEHEIMNESVWGGDAAGCEIDPRLKMRRNESEIQGT